MSASKDDKLWAALSHGLVLTGAHILAPLIIYLVKKDGSEMFVIEHARESLNFQISVLIYGFGLAALIATVVLMPLAILALWALGLFTFVLVIVATIKAASGETFEYPLNLRLVK
jgi:uncharacterized Tic20 family protein